MKQNNYKNLSNLLFVLALAALLLAGVYVIVTSGKSGLRDVAEIEAAQSSDTNGLSLACEALKSTDPRYNAILSGHLTAEYHDVVDQTPSGLGDPQVRLDFKSLNASGDIEEIAVYSEIEPTRVVYVRSKDIIKGFMEQYKDMPGFADMRFGICIFKNVDGQIIGDFETLQRVEEG